MAGEAGKAGWVGTVAKMRLSAVVLMCVAAGLVSQSHTSAQARTAQAAPPQPSPTPRAAAPIDLTGYWVSIVNEDWRWRMVTPPKGDYSSVPLNDAGRRLADTWDTSKDGRCEAYGAAALMRMPTRLHITWESETVLKIETDAGQQTRRVLFDKSRPAPTARSLQGFSIAEWDRPARPGGPGRGGRGEATGPAPGANLKVITNHLIAGWLRKNGVPYSEDTVVTEYFDRFATPTGDEWLAVTTMVTDPKYLNTDFVTSSHFKKEPDGSKWSPSPCKTS
jgi:hypothetical protein